MQFPIHLSLLSAVLSQLLQDLCTLLHELYIGRDIGIVMARGVVIGVLCCIIFLPALILQFDRVIEKTKHHSLIPDLGRVSNGLQNIKRFSLYCFWFFLGLRCTETVIQRFTIILINLCLRHWTVLWRMKSSTMIFI